MKYLFDFDGPIMRFLGRITDYIKLSLVWVVCSIPLVTIVPATSALYYVTLRMVTDTEAGVIKDFFRAFKDNFKQGIKIALVLIPVTAILIVDIYLTSQMTNFPGRVVYALMLGVSGCCFGTLLYVFPLQAKFENSVKGTLRNAFLLAMQHFPSTILVFVLNFIPVFVAVFKLGLFLRMLPIWILIEPALIAYLCSKRYVKIFEPLIPDTTES